MGKFDIFKMIIKAGFKRAANEFQEVGIYFWSGAKALNEHRFSRLMKVIEPHLVTAEELAANPKYIQLEKDVAEMAAKAGLKPPKLIVSQIVGFCAPSNKAIFVPLYELERLSSAELKAAAGHELTHIKKGDHLHFSRPFNHRQERAADRGGAILSGEPDAMISFIKQIPSDRPGMGTRTYPSHKSRIHSLRKVKEEMTQVEQIEAQKASAPVREK